jgi:hypothetical protein
MPTYRNDTDHRITHADMGYMAWQPGEEKRLPFFVPHEELELTLVSDDPPAAGETSVARDWFIELTPNDPITLKLGYFEAFELSIHTVEGAAIMRIGDSETDVYITSEESHWSSYSYARCPYLTFSSEEAALIRVKQEERNTRNTLRRGGV